jgi:hypothetical protein
LSLARAVRLGGSDGRFFGWAKIAGSDERQEFPAIPAASGNEVEYAKEARAIAENQQVPTCARRREDQDGGASCAPAQNRWS